MTVSESFVKLLESKGVGIFGQNIFLWRVPNSLKTPTELFYLIPSGGSITRRLASGDNVRLYQFLIYFRSNSAERVDKVLNALEENLSCSGCISLEDYETLGVQVNMLPVDQDADSENRMVGTLQVQVEVYKKCK